MVGVLVVVAALGGVVYTILDDPGPDRIDAGRRPSTGADTTAEDRATSPLPPGCEELAIVAVMGPERQRLLSATRAAANDADEVAHAVEVVDRFRDELLSYHATAFDDLGRAVPELQEPAATVRHFVVDAVTAFARAESSEGFVAALDGVWRAQTPEVVQAFQALIAHQVEACPGLDVVFGADELAPPAGE